MRRANPWAAAAAVLILLAAWWGVQRWADHRDAASPSATSRPTTSPPGTTRPVTTKPTTANPPTTSAAPIPGVPGRPPGATEMVMLYAYDGDTIQARVKQPSTLVTTTEPIRIRLVGINATEGTPQKQCWSQESRAALAAMLPTNATIWVAADKSTWDDYGRRLFNVWTADGRFVDYAMVAEGHAEAIRVYPNITYYSLLAKAQDTATAAKKGLWGACGSIPPRPAKAAH